MPLIAYLTDVLQPQLSKDAGRKLCSVEGQLIGMGVGDDSKARVMRWEMQLDDPPSG